VGVVGGGGAEVGEGVEVGVGVVAGAGVGPEKEPLAFSKGDECHWPSESGLCLFRRRLLCSPWPRGPGRGLLPLRRFGGACARAALGVWRSRVRGAVLGRASQWRTLRGVARAWHKAATSARAASATSATCGPCRRRARAPPPQADPGRYLEYRRAGEGGCARTARADCGAGQAA
jgi:hypothetical protein